MANADEDKILDYFNVSRSGFGFYYRENEDDQNYKQELKGIEAGEKKLEWISNYTKELKNAFFDLKEFYQQPSVYKNHLLELGVTFPYPFILKAYRLFRNEGDKAQKLEQVFRALEIVAFRDEVVRTRADLRSKLNWVLKTFTSVADLVAGIKNVYENMGYWTDNAMRSALMPDSYKLGNIAPYIFKRYENHLRQRDVRAKNHTLQITKPEIEHIAPQTETNQHPASGYCAYDEAFVAGCYLHKIGNLMLIGESHNISIGNQPFEEKLASYEASPLLQHQEIKNFATNST
ncbi:HNH endonuclease family protein [Helicobacter sp. NHP22-001]|uniref:HNH endonuclease family protein n=1 Tax=Helicobacter sp. NHP22-001 TaxID=3040202 RepID=UPI00244D914E|nr:HNH endonuclease family protein [Helicobacter sp. NHP22-001]GMB96347.1 hypothetical protein NHP22001_09360 [Helicobacter sp. NHP22-001]